MSTGAVANGNDVNLVTTLTTGAGDQSGAFKVTAGNNITLTPSSTSITIGANTKANQGNITISAKDTTYTLGADTNTTKGVLSLSADGGTDSSVDIIGSTTNGTADGFTKVTSNSTNNTIEVKGVSFDTTGNAISVSNHTTDGFQITLGGTKGDGDPFTVHSAVFTPHITYGQGANPATVGFANGTATLDIYTKDETDDAIDDAIDAKLSTANAMTYRGTIDFGTENFITKVEANGGLHNGDVYKISGLNSQETLEFDNKIADVGDLIIVSGTETNGIVPYTSGSLSSLLSHCNLVPSGDEPEVQASVTPSATTTNPSTF
ncbi:MAG: hypothetical protein J6W64_10395 [Bacilli bacterium]|nr:hypothetical protein [Bacilli bacterium]MBO7536130.1 hypothetical protein [Bacilli bacterium]